MFPIIPIAESRCKRMQEISKRSFGLRVEVPMSINYYFQRICKRL